MVDELQAARVGLLDNVPEELKQTPQWVVCLYSPGHEMDKVPCWAPDVFSPLRRASPTDSGNWMPFDRARHLVASNPGTVAGFVLTALDPFCCIDLDVKETTSQDQLEEFWQLATTFDTYVESSPSERGLHIWCKANIGEGVRAGGVEIYSQERFMTFTGQVVINKQLEERQAVAELLKSSLLGKRKNQVVDLVEVASEKSDADVWNQASTAHNAEKFLALFAGNWQDLGYPSRSEADLSLMSMLCFYSPSNEQCKRIFRYSALGKRDKATKNDRYLNLTLQQCRARLESERVTEDWAKQAAENFQKQLLARMQPQYTPPPTLPTNSQELESYVEAKIAEVEADPYEQPPTGYVPTEPITTESLDWPPGLVGIVAQYIYNNAPTPVKEIAIIGALGFFAGVFGRSHNVSRTGLNLYLILLARSGVGKEGMQTGISSLIKELQGGCPGIADFFEFGDFASGPALLKTAIAKCSILNISSEFGRKLSRLASDSNDGPSQTLRTTMTMLYQKSGAGQLVGGMVYSNKEQNVSSIVSVSYSFIGESTPNTFYECLTQSMMEDGFLSRFTTIEYNGERPATRNMDEYFPLDAHIRSYLQGAVNASAKSKLEHTEPIQVGYYSDAKELLDNFSLECTENINGTDDDGRRQLWNRAHLKALRISALLAVGDNPHQPMITIQHAQWGINVVRRDIDIFIRRYENGDIGQGDYNRIMKMAKTIERLLMDGKPNRQWHPMMRHHSIVTQSILVQRLSRISQFTSHPQGSTRAIELTLKSMVDQGYLAEVSKDELIKSYNFAGRAYRTLSLPKETNEDC